MTAPARACTLMRVLNPGSVCLRLGDTGAFVLAELSPPLSPRSHVAAQRVHALAPVPATVTLGPYNVARARIAKAGKRFRSLPGHRKPK